METRETTEDSFLYHNKEKQILNTIEKLGDEETFRDIVKRTITEFEDNEIEIHTRRQQTGPVSQTK